MNITLKNLKINDRLSDETTCFSATVVLDGKPIGTASNRGCGGCDEYHWTDREAGKRLEEYARTLPKVEAYGMTFNPDLGSLIADLIDKQEEEKTLRRWCKTQVVFRLKTDKANQWRKLKAPWTKAALKVLREVNGDNLDRVANLELLGEPVLEGPK